MTGLKSIGAVVIVCFGLFSTASAKDSVELKNAKGESVGHVLIYNGMHAIHIHQFAKCEADPDKPDDAFKSAGSHFNPEGKKHGTKNPDGPHAGDLAN